MTGSIFMAGVAREDITPAVGTLLFGYNPFTESNSIHDPLQVTTIAFQQGETTSLLISVTLGGIQNELAGEIRSKLCAKTGVPAEHIIIAATHTHSGPNTVGMEGWGEIDRYYVDTVLIPMILKTGHNAIQTLQPAELAVGVVRSEVGINRRKQYRDGRVDLGHNPWGSFDPSMTVISIRNSETKNGIVNLIHYGCHGTAAGQQTAISRDWSGIMIDRLEMVTGTITAYWNGAEGDVGPRLTNGRDIGDFQYVEELGGVAASDALRAYQACGVYKPGNLKIYTGHIHIPRKDLLSKETIYAKLALYENPEELINIQKMEYTYYKASADAYENDCPSYEKEMVFGQTILALGDIVFIPFPFEIFSEIALRLRAYSPYRYTLSLSNTNGYNAYLPSEDQIVRGGYEIACFRYNSVHPLVDYADQVLINENLRIMEQ